MSKLSKYRTRGFLTGHIKSIMDFYYPGAIDRERGGFHQEFHDDGRLGDPDVRHLVSSCRFVYNFAIASRILDSQIYLEAARHGLTFLNEAHLRDDGGYAWILSGREVVDGTRHCYGHAFVLLAHAAAAKAGLSEGRVRLVPLFEMLEERFFEPEHGLYADEIAAGDWSAISPYRGQNANMHMCEAMIAAYEASRDIRFLDRAIMLARRICVDLAGKVTGGEGFIWEHYTGSWSHDWDYNRDDPHNLFRTYGFVLGHFAEWAKLLTILYRYRPEPWMLERARTLFGRAMEISWDHERTGMRYTIWPDGTPLDDTRYFWTHAESLAAAAGLAVQTGEKGYWDWYERIWSFTDRYLVDHDHGAWFRVLDDKNSRIAGLKSPPGKTDYHGLSACYETLQVLDFAGI